MNIRLHAGSMFPPVWYLLLQTTGYIPTEACDPPGKDLTEILTFWPHAELRCSGICGVEAPPSRSTDRRVWKDQSLAKGEKEA